MHDFDLHNRRALITGSSQGIGRAIAATLRHAGAQIVIHHAGPDDADQAHATAQQLDAAGVIAADLADHHAPENLLQTTRELLGGIDIAVLNVAVQTRQPIEDPFDPQAFDRMIRINLRANTQLMLDLLREMRQQHWGRILHIGSVQQDQPSPQLVHYAATKSAMLNVVRNLAKQAAPDSVTVNNLSPGIIHTPRNNDVLSIPEQSQYWTQRIPARRIGLPEECAGAALLLCSDAGRYITGIDLRVDGGLSL